MATRRFVVGKKWHLLGYAAGNMLEMMKGPGWLTRDSFNSTSWEPVLKPECVARLLFRGRHNIRLLKRRDDGQIQPNATYSSPTPEAVKCQGKKNCSPNLCSFRSENSPSIHLRLWGTQCENDVDTHYNNRQSDDDISDVLFFILSCRRLLYDSSFVFLACYTW